MKKLFKTTLLTLVLTACNNKTNIVQPKINIDSLKERKTREELIRIHNDPNTFDFMVYGENFYKKLN